MNARAAPWHGQAWHSHDNAARAIARQLDDVERRIDEHRGAIAILERERAALRRQLRGTPAAAQATRP